MGVYLGKTAVAAYVGGVNGSKIDSISVNGVVQPIDENKNVDITVPEIDLSDYSTTEQMNTAIAASIGNAIAASY